MRPKQPGRQRPGARDGKRPGPAGPGSSSKAGGARRDSLSLALDLVVLAIAVVYLVALWKQSAQAVFSSDECFHAHVSEWIAQHGRLPRELPELYSGLPYFYPPLLHILGAVAFKIAGAAALKVVNTALTAALLALVLALPVPGFGRDARRCAALLCIASPSLYFYASIFYAETLATVLAAAVVMLLLRARARPGVREGVLLGVAVGAAQLAKQPAPILSVLLAVLAIIDFARGRRPLAATMAIALGTGLAISLPYFVRNLVLHGAPLSPPITTLAQVTLNAMNTSVFSQSPPVFYRNALIFVGPIVPWLTLVALAWNVVRGRFNVITGLLAGCVAFILLAPWVPRFEPRHLNPITAMLAVLGSLVVTGALARRRWLSIAAQLILIGWTVVFVSRTTGQRQWADSSAAAQETFRAVAQFVPADGTVLSRSTYDTFYYSRRNATWPIPWARASAQLDLFAEADPDRFLAALDRLGIGYLLLPREGSERGFTGTNFPRTFVACVATLVDRGSLKVLWGSADQVLVGRSEPAASAP